MTADRYHSYDELRQQEVLNRDYRIIIRDVGSAVTIIAPHGGRIEPETAEIARKIADRRYNCYCFEGIKPEKNRRLHLTSHKFDEPRAIRILSRSIAVVAIHACTGNHAGAYLGGLDTALKEKIACELQLRHIDTSTDHPAFKGHHPDNICNRGLTRRGVQLEISRGLRDDPEKRKLIAEAVSASLAHIAT